MLSNAVPVCASTKRYTSFKAAAGTNNVIQTLLKLEFHMLRMLLLQLKLEKRVR